MTRQTNSLTPGIRQALLISAGLSLAAVVVLVNQAWGSGTYLGMARGWLLRLLPVAAWAGAALWMGLAQRFPGSNILKAAVERAGRIISRLGWVNVLVWLVLPVLFVLLVWQPSIGLVERSLPRWWIFAHLALLGGALLYCPFRRGNLWAWSAFSLLGWAALLKVYAFFPEISSYPFSLGWSEASRYYNASLFFAPRVYGQAAPLPVLHPSRYLMQSLPFAVPVQSIWFHRFWQVMLWVGMSGLTGWALARRLKVCWGWGFLAGLWAALFLFQGAVYYHLLAAAVIVLLGFDRRRSWRTLLVVAAAGLWAGISRINWIPLPGALAALLYFLEEPLEGNPSGVKHGWGTILRYLSWPAAWMVCSLLAGAASQAVYPLLSGNPPGDFGSSLTSDLLWYRLWPNSTFAPGIVRAALWVCLPVLLILVYRMARSFSAWSVVRWLGIWLILLVFFAGGLVVSVKIGGGGDLHNLDAFLTLLCVTGLSLALDRFVPDWPERERPSGLQPALTLFALLVPVLPVLALVRPGPARDLAAASASLTRLQQHLDEAGGGEVLMISERHLLTFHLVSGPVLVPEYEKVFLMEMAMGNNRAYLDRFQQDLRARRFSLIVSDPVNSPIKDQSYSFSEENNAWVERVVLPLLESYTPIDTLEGGAVVILAPKP